MKKIFAFALAMTLVVAFSSCNNKKNAPEQGEEYIDPADVPFENGFKLVINYIKPFECLYEVVAEDVATPFLGGYLFADDADTMTDTEIALSVLQSIQDYIAQHYQETGEQIPLTDFMSYESNSEWLTLGEPSSDYVAVAFYCDAETFAPIITDEQGVARKRFRTKDVTEREAFTVPSGYYQNEEEFSYYSFWGDNEDASIFLDFYTPEPLVNGLHITNANFTFGRSTIGYHTGEFDEEGNEDFYFFDIYSVDLNVTLSAEGVMSVTGNFIAYDGIKYTLNFTGVDATQSGDEEVAAPARRKATPARKKVRKI